MNFIKRVLSVAVACAAGWACAAESLEGLTGSTAVRSVAAVQRPQTDDVLLTFGAGEAGTWARLYRVYGETDGGENRLNWEFCDDLGEVRFDTLSRVCAYPEGWGDKVKFVKFFLGGPSGEQNEFVRVDYIDSSENYAKWSVAFDTECNLAQDARIECEAEVRMNASGWQWQMLFGVCKDTGGTIDANSLMFFVRNSSSWVPRYSRPVNAIGTDFPYGEKVKVVVVGQTASWYRDGETTPAGSLTSSGTYAAGVRSLYIFDANDGNPDHGGARGGTVDAKLYSFCIYAGDSLVHEFLPVRAKDKATGAWTGALVDTQNDNRLHYNVGAAPRVLFAKVVDDGTPQTGSRTLEPVVESDAVRLVEIVEGAPAGEVNLRFGPGTDGAYTKLYMAYGSADGGPDRAKWEHVEQVAWIAGDEQTATVSLPVGWGETAFAVRFFLGERAEMRRVDYLDSTVNYNSSGKSHYFDTEYVHQAETRVECEAEVDKYENPNDFLILFGVSGDLGAHAESSYSFFVRAGLQWVPRYNRSELTVGSNFVYGRKVKVVTEGNTACWYRDGETTPAGTISGGGTYADGVNTMFIFDMNAANAEPSKTARGGTVYGKLYSFRLYEGDEMVREFLPVLVPGKAAGTWTGALYETRNKKIHSNLGNASSVAVGPFVDDGTPACGSQTLSLPISEALWPRQVDLVKRREDFARLRFATGATNTYSRLYMAYGVTDGGSHRADWAHCVDLGAVRWDVTEKDCPWPEGWGEDVNYVRYFLEGSSSCVPVAYIDSSVNYYSSSHAFDTEYVHHAETRVECEATVYATKAGYAWEMLFGVCGANGNLYESSYSFFVLDNSTWTPRFNRSAKAYGAEGTAFVYGEKVKVVTQGNTASWYRDGETTPAGTITGGGSYADGTHTMFILDMNEASATTPKKKRTGTVSARLYSFRMFEGDEMAREFLPARKLRADGTWTGVLYETKTGKVHENIGAVRDVAYGEDVSLDYSKTIQWRKIGGLFIVVR